MFVFKYISALEIKNLRLEFMNNGKFISYRFDASQVIGRLVIW